MCLSVDPLAEQFPNWNPYHYVHNNPINLIDPTGMSAQDPGGGNPDKKPQNNLSLSTIKKDINDNYSKSGMKDIGDFLSSLLGSSKITDKKGAVDFYSKDGGGEGQKTTGTVEERREGSALLTLANFAGAPIKSFKSGSTGLSFLGEIKKVGEVLKEGIDAGQSFVNLTVADSKVIINSKDTTYSVIGYSRKDLNNQAHPSFNPVGIKNARSVSKELLQFDNIDSISIKVKEIK